MIDRLQFDARALTHFSILMAIVIGSLLFRLNYNQETRIDQPVRGDAAYYMVYAGNLIHHQTFSKERNSEHPTPDAYWAPGYPAFLATVMATADTIALDPYTTILATQAVLGAGTVLLTYLLGLLFLPRGLALAAALLQAISPHAVSLGSYLLTETLFSFLLTLSVFAYARAMKDYSAGWASFGSISLGLTYLVNPTVIVVLPIILLAAASTSSRTAQASGSSTRTFLLSAALPVACVAALWSVRGLVSVPADSASSGDRLLINLIVGMFSDYHDVWRANPRDPNNPATIAATAINGSYLKWLQMLWAQLSADPFGTLSWYLVGKPILLWDWSIRIGQGDIYVYPVFYSLYDLSDSARVSYSIMKSAHFWLLASALLGIVFSIKETSTNRNALLVTYGTVILISAVYVISQAEPRYSVPLRPLFYLLGTYGLWSCYSFTRARNKKAVF